MLRTTGLAVVICLFLALSGQGAEETYSIQVKPVALGDLLTVTKATTQDKQVTIKDGDKILSEQRRFTLQDFAFTEEILAREGDKRPTRLSRRYARARWTDLDKSSDLPPRNKPVLIEKKDGKYAFHIEGGKDLALGALPYQGKTVLIEKKDGKYSFQLEGKDFPGDPKDPLQVEFLREEVFDVYSEVLPTKPVAVEESWKVDVEKLAKELGRGDRMEVDLSRAAGTGTLVRIYKKDGHLFGEMSFKIELPLKAIAHDKKKIMLDPGASYTAKFTMDGCIDGSVRALSRKGTIELTVTGPVTTADGQQAKLAMNFKGSAEETEEAAPKK